jgi:hypothetical protein
MADAVVNTGEVMEGNDWFLTYRLVRADGTVVAQTDTSDDTGATALTVKAYTLNNQAAVAEEPVYSATVAGGSANIDKNVMASLKTDGFWGGVDSTGYNFFYRVPYGTWMKGGNRYKIEFDLTLISTASSDHGAVAFGSIRWASIIYVKSMTSIG